MEQERKMVKSKYATDFNEIVEQNKNWAKNIADAWELFEEMPGALLSKSDTTEDGRDIYHCRNDSMEKCFMEWSFEAPMAICLAWINWKEKNA